MAGDPIGSSPSSPYLLERLDPNTGGKTTIGTGGSDFTLVGALDTSPDGTIYAAGLSGALGTVDTTTGVISNQGVIWVPEWGGFYMRGNSLAIPKN